MWPPTITFNINLISQTDRKGGRCILVKILSIERDINTLTMGAGTHVIFNIAFHLTSCQVLREVLKKTKMAHVTSMESQRHYRTWTG